MDHGQGAHAALPIWGMFMEKVYADSVNLGYSPSARFDIPKGFDPCADYSGVSSKPVENYTRMESF